MSGEWTQAALHLARAASDEAAAHARAVAPRDKIFPITSGHEAFKGTLRRLIDWAGSVSEAESSAAAARFFAANPDLRPRSDGEAAQMREDAEARYLEEHTAIIPGRTVRVIRNGVEKTEPMRRWLP